MIQKILFCLISLTPSLSLAQTTFEYDQKGNQLLATYSGNTPCNSDQNTESTKPQTPIDGLTNGKDNLSFETLKNRNSESVSESNVTLKIVPNPSKDLITIEYKLAKSTQASISLYNLDQQLIKQFSPMFQETGVYQLSYDVSVLPSGIYFCVLRTEEELLVFRVVRE